MQKLKFIILHFLLLILMSNCWTWQAPLTCQVTKGDITCKDKDGNDILFIPPQPPPVTQVVTPGFSPEPATYSSDQNITISTTTEGATIYYTTDDTEPTKNSDKYTEPILVSGDSTTKTIKAIATKTGWKDSEIASGTYTIDYGEVTPVSTPTFDPVAGTYNSDQSVGISTTTSGATIYYTTNGTTPTTSSTQYSSAISVAGNGTSMTIKAIATKSGMTDSSVASGTYTINYDAVAIPTFSPTGGTYTTDQSVLLSTTTSGATIYYTTDGSEPATSITGSTLQYSTPIPVTGNGTTKLIKAIAVKSGMNNSSLASGEFTINYESIDIWNGIVAYYPFYGNAKDESGPYSNDGTVNGATLTTDKFGNPNRSYSFGGLTSPGKISVMKNASSNPISAMTISVLYYLKDPTGMNGYGQTVNNGAHCVVTRGGDFGGYASNTFYRDNKLSLNFYGTGYLNNVYSLENYSLQNWVRISYLVDTNSFKLYFNDNLAGSFSGTFDFNKWNSHDWYFGMFGYGSWYPLNGKLDDIRIYNRALNPTEIQMLYRNQGTAPSPESTTISTSIVTSTSMTLSWSQATDSQKADTNEYVTPQSKLQYKVVRSTSNNITDVDSCNQNGTVVKNWTTSLTTYTDSTMSSGTNYWFNVLARDEHGNISAYTMVKKPGFTIGGTTSGLTASGLVLKNNGGDNLTVSSGAGSFAFSIPIATGESYSVTIQSQPTGLSCSVFSATGTVASSNITSVNVRCSSVSETYSWGTFTDQFNGTVKFVSVSGTFGGNSYTAQTLYFMKCSQGQTWNSGTNNCDGNSGMYQFCTTLNNNCNGGVITNELGVGGFLGGSISEAYNQCNNLVFTGKTNWRMPTDNELKTLIHCTNKIMPFDWSYCGNGNYNSPSVNNLFSTIANDYWTSSTTITNIGQSITVSFSNGDLSGPNKTESYYIRCVRDP